MSIFSILLHIFHEVGHWYNLYTHNNIRITESYSVKVVGTGTEPSLFFENPARPQSAQK